MNIAFDKVVDCKLVDTNNKYNGLLIYTYKDKEKIRVKGIKIDTTYLSIDTDVKCRRIKHIENTIMYQLQYENLKFIVTIKDNGDIVLVHKVQ